MAQYNKNDFRALIVPDTRVNKANIDSANSSFTQAGNRVGIPEPQAATNLSLEASGTQSANKQLRIATQRSGFPGQGGATFRWKNESDSATQWRGAWPPSTFADWRMLQVGDPGGGHNVIKEAVHPNAVLMDDGKIGVVYHQVIQIIGTDNHRVVFLTIDSDGTVSSTTTLYNRVLSPTQGLHPCIMKLPDGRLMVYHYLEDKVQDLVQVQAFTSTDNGSNWTLANSACLDESIDVSSATAAYDLDYAAQAKMRVCYSGGQVLLLISHTANDTSGTYRAGFHQYASSNLGQSFQQVEVWGLEVVGCQQSIVPSSNGFEVFYVGRKSGNDSPYRKSLSSAFIPLSTATSFQGPAALQNGDFRIGAFSTDKWNSADMEVVIGDDGILYAVANARRDGVSSNVSNTIIAMDVTGGSNRLSNYRMLGQGTCGTAGSAPNTGMIYWSNNSTDKLRDYTLVAAHGRIAMFTNWNAGTATNDDSLAVGFLGGYNDVSLGQYQDDGDYARQVCWDYQYLPIELPNNSGNAWAATGTGTVSVENGYLSVVTSSSTQRYTQTPPGTVSEGIICHFGVQHISQTGPASDLVFVRLTQADGSDKYTADIYIRNGAIFVKDNNGGTQIGTISIDTQAAGGIEVLAFFRNGKITCYARLRDGAADKQWTVVCSSGTISDSGTGSSEVRFGHIAGSTASSRWFFLNYVSDEYAGGVDSSTGFTNPDDLTGKPFNNLGSTYVDDGVKIRGIDGPTLPGDNWNIDTRYDYGFEQMLVPIEPSPAKGWRSTNTSANTIAWTFTGPNDYRTIGLYLDGCNWRTGSLQGWNGSAWVSLASIDMASGQTSLAYVRNGDAVTVNTGATTAPGRYYERGELEGGTIDLGSSKIRRVTDNTPGVWTNTANHVLPGIRFSGVDNTEPANGTLNIWSPRILIVVHNITPVYTKLKLVIDSQSTADGDLRVGQAVIGGVELFSQDYSYGRKIETVPNTNITTYSDGSRSAFKLGDNRRIVQFGWADGVDTTHLQGTSIDADYVMGTSTGGSSPVGYRGDTPSRVQQLIAHTAGPNLPVVYCPSVQAGSSGNDVKAIQGLSGSLYGRIIGPVAVDNLVGNELDGDEGEVFKIGNITIEEEL